MIRYAQKEDCLNLAALSIQVWLDTYAPDGIRTELSQYVLNRFTPVHYLKLLDDPKYCIRVFMQDAHLVGFVVADLESNFNNDRANGYEICTLYVQPQFKGKGVGKKLLNDMAQKGGETYWLTTWVYNYKAIEFYQYMGFCDIGRTFFDLDGEKHENRVFLLRPRK